MNSSKSLRSTLTATSKTSTKNHLINLFDQKNFTSFDVVKLLIIFCQNPEKTSPSLIEAANLHILKSTEFETQRTLPSANAALTPLV